MSFTKDSVGDGLVFGFIRRPMGDNRKLTNISNARLWMQLSLRKRRKETRDIIIQRAGQSRELPMMIATAGLQKEISIPNQT